MGIVQCALDYKRFPTKDSPDFAVNIRSKEDLLGVSCWASHPAPSPAFLFLTESSLLILFPSQKKGSTKKF